MTSKVRIIILMALYMVWSQCQILGVQVCMHGRAASEGGLLHFHGSPIGHERHSQDHGQESEGHRHLEATEADLVGATDVYEDDCQDYALNLAHRPAPASTEEDLAASAHDCLYVEPLVSISNALAAALTAESRVVVHRWQGGPPWTLALPLERLPILII